MTVGKPGHGQHEQHSVLAHAAVIRDFIHGPYLLPPVPTPKSVTKMCWLGHRSPFSEPCTILHYITSPHSCPLLRAPPSPGRVSETRTPGVSRIFSGSQACLCPLARHTAGPRLDSQQGPDYLLPLERDPSVNRLFWHGRDCCTAAASWRGRRSVSKGCAWLYGNHPLHWARYRVAAEPVSLPT
jgi:hypothetical protein